MAFNLGNIKSPSFLKPLTGDYLFKIENKKLLDFKMGAYESKEMVRKENDTKLLFEEAKQKTIDFNDFISAKELKIDTPSTTKTTTQDYFKLGEKPILGEILRRAPGETFEAAKWLGILSTPVIRDKFIEEQPETAMKYIEEYENLWGPFVRKAYPTRIPLAIAEKIVGHDLAVTYEEIAERAPVNAVIGGLMGDIYNLVAISTLTGGVKNYVKLPSLFQAAHPTLTAHLPKALHGAVTWGMRGLLDEATTQFEQGEFDPVKLSSETGKNALFGALIAGTNVFESKSVNILLGGAARGSWAAVEAYLKEGKITAQDIPNIATNTILGMVFNAINAKGVVRRLKQQKLDVFLHRQAVVSTGLPEKEAEKIVSLIEKLGGLQKMPPAIVERIKLQIPKGLQFLSQTDQVVMADKILPIVKSEVLAGTPIWDAVLKALQSVGFPRIEIPIGMTIKDVSEPSKEVIPSEEQPVYHGTNVDIATITKEGLKVDKIGEVTIAGSQYPGIFSTFKADYAKNFGKNIFKIDTSEMNILNTKTPEGLKAWNIINTAGEENKNMKPIIAQFRKEGIDGLTNFADADIMFFRDIRPDELFLNDKRLKETDVTQYKTLYHVTTPEAAKEINKTGVPTLPKDKGFYAWRTREEAEEYLKSLKGNKVIVEVQAIPWNVKDAVKRKKTAGPYDVVFSEKDFLKKEVKLDSLELQAQNALSLESFLKSTLVYYRAEGLKVGVAKLGEGSYITTDKDVVVAFAKISGVKKPKIIRYGLKGDLKIMSEGGPEFSKIKGDLGFKPWESPASGSLASKILTNYVKEAGYDGVRSQDRFTGTVIFDKSNLLTRKQLTDIYNKFNIPTQETEISAQENFTDRQGEIQAETIALMSDMKNNVISNEDAMIRLEKLQEEFKKIAASIDTPSYKTIEIFEGYSELTTNVLNLLKGKTTVNKQFIIDALKREGVKPGEKLAFDTVLEEYKSVERVPVKEFADKVKLQLLPLSRQDRWGHKGGYVSPADMTPEIKEDLEHGIPPIKRFEFPYTVKGSKRGFVSKYSETIYQSPALNDAGGKHYSQHDFPGYFGHVRKEDMVDTKAYTMSEALKDKSLSVEDRKAMTLKDKRFYLQGKIRRLVEIQSDFFQDKVYYDKAKYRYGLYTSDLPIFRKAIKETTEHINAGITLRGRDIPLSHIKEFVKMNDDYDKLMVYFKIWYQRLIREEIKLAADDDKDILRFPTGATAMNIEGYGEEGGNEWFEVMTDRPTVQGDQLTQAYLKQGMIIRQGTGNAIQKWIVTLVMRNGQFKAMPVTYKESFLENVGLFKDNKFNAGVKIIKTVYQGQTYYFNKDTVDSHIRDSMTEKDWTIAQQLDEMIENRSETFNVSSHVNKNHPIYKFYEVDIPNFLRKIRPDLKLVTDEQGITWFETHITEKDKEAVIAFKKGEYIGKMISGKEAINNALEIIDRLKLTNMETELVKTILTGDGGQALARSFGNKLSFTEMVPEFAGEHEIIHTIHKNVDNIKLFTSQGITKAKLDNEILAAYSDLNTPKDLYEEMTIPRRLMERLAEDGELHFQMRLANKPTTLTGKIKQFFDIIWETLKKIFTGDNRTITRKFFDIIESGQAKEETRIEKRGPPAYKRGPSLVHLGIHASPKEIVTTDSLLLRARLRAETRGAKWGVKTAKIHIQKIKKSYRLKDTTIQQTKQILVDYIRHKLPLFVRGKLIAQVKQVKNDRQLMYAINLVDKYAEETRQKILRSKIEKELKSTKAKVDSGILKGKYTADVQRTLDTIKANIFADKDDARDKMIDNISKYQEGKLSYDDMRSNNEILSLLGIQGMTSDELYDVLDTIRSIKDNGKTIRELQAFNENTRIQRIKERLVDILTGNQGIREGVASIPTKDLELRQGKIGTSVEKILNWQYGWDDIMDKLSKFDSKSKQFESDLSKFAGEIHESRRSQDEGEEKYLKHIQRKVKEIFGIEKKQELNAFLNSLKGQDVDIGTFKNTDGVSVHLKLTKEQLMKKYQELQDITLDNTFRNTMKWTDEMMDAVNDSLTDKEKSWADYHMEFYQTYYDTVNDVYREYYGVDLPHNLNYSPISRDIESTVAENVLLAREASQYASTINGSLKSRTKTTAPLKFSDATGTLINHVFRMEHFKAWTASMRDMRRIFGDDEIRTAIRQYHGSDMLRTIDNYLTDMARDSIDRMLINKGCDILRKNFTKAVLGIKPAIALKQMPSVWAYSTEMSFKDFIGGILDFWKHPLKNYHTMVDASPFLRKRFSVGFERDIKFAMQKSVSKTITKTGSFSDWFMLLIKSGDKFAVSQGSWAKYRSELNKGSSTDAAIRAAEATTKRTQPTFDLETMSSLQRGGSFMKLLTMFQNQPNKYFRIIANNARNIKFGRQSVAKGLSNIFLAWVMLPVLFQFIADAFRVDKKHMARAIVLGPLNDILVAGQLIRTGYGWLSGETFDAQISPVFSTLHDLQIAITKSVKLVKEGKDPYKIVDIDDVISAVEYYAKVGGQLTGLPTPYAIQAEKAIRRGEPIEMLFTPYSLGRSTQTTGGGIPSGVFDSDQFKMPSMNDLPSMNMKDMDMNVPSMKLK